VCLNMFKVIGFALRQIRLQAHPSISPGTTGHKRHTYVAPHGTTIQTSMRSVRAANVSERRLAAEADFAGGFETRCITPLQRPSPEGKTGVLDDTRKRHESGCVTAVLAPRPPDPVTAFFIRMSWGQFCASICLVTVLPFFWCKPQLKQSQHPNCQVQTSCYLRKILPIDLQEARNNCPAVRYSMRVPGITVSSSLLAGTHIHCPEGSFTCRLGMPVVLGCLGCPGCPGSPALRLQSATLPTVEFARVGAWTPTTELQGFPVKM
jgi:hypothetical protein